MLHADTPEPRIHINRTHGARELDREPANGRAPQRHSATTVASVAAPVCVPVALGGVGCQRAVVDVGADAVTVRVIRRVVREAVARITDVIAVAILLGEIADSGAVVGLIPAEVAVEIAQRLEHVRTAPLGRRDIEEVRSALRWEVAE